MLTLSALEKCSFNYNCIKTAFLQGKDLEHTVFVRTPKEAQTNKIWQLQKCAYGLTNASSYLHLKI